LRIGEADTGQVEGTSDSLRSTRMLL